MFHSAIYESNRELTSFSEEIVKSQPDASLNQVNWPGISNGIVWSRMASRFNEWQTMSRTPMFIWEG